MRGYSVFGHFDGGFLHGTVEVDLEVVLMSRTEFRTIESCWRAPRFGITCGDHDNDVVERLVNLSPELQCLCITEYPKPGEYPVSRLYSESASDLNSDLLGVEKIQEWDVNQYGS